MQHQISGFKHMLDRTNKLPMSEEEHNKEIRNPKQ
jgi:hypothetical protein